MLYKKVLWGCLSLLLLSNTGEGPKRQHATKPNVLFIMIDDLGWKDVGFMGSAYYETPHVDAIAREGMMFMNAYSASPLCSATRTSILSGTWPSRNGLTGAAGHLKEVRLKAELVQPGKPTQKALAVRGASRLNPAYYTLGEAFKDAGYTTAHIGKWHVGDGPSNPLKQGFDIDIPHTNAPSPLPDGWFAPWPVWPGEGKTGDHLEDRMAEEAVQFIQQHKDTPFILNYWAFSVHSPWNAKQELVDKYAAKTDAYAGQHTPVYAAMVESMDQAVGRLMQTLKEENLLDNTIVIFYSDNGGWIHGARRFVHPDYVNVPMTTNFPLRDGKASVYEGGTRVPLVISWPGHISTGAVNRQAIVSSVDIYPTLLDLCGIQPNEEAVFDGVSIRKALEGRELERDEIYCHFPHYTPATGNVPSSYVRKGDWKLIVHYADQADQTDRIELFNLRTDIGEAINLVASYPEKVEELKILLAKHLQQTGAIVPIPNPAYKK